MRGLLGSRIFRFCRSQGFAIGLIWLDLTEDHFHQRKILPRGFDLATTNQIVRGFNQIVGIVQRRFSRFELGGWENLAPMLLGPTERIAHQTSFIFERSQ